MNKRGPIFDPRGTAQSILNGVFQGINFSEITSVYKKKFAMYGSPLVKVSAGRPGEDFRETQKRTNLHRWSKQSRCTN